MKTAAYCKTCRHALVCRPPLLCSVWTVVRLWSWCEFSRSFVVSVTPTRGEHMEEEALYLDFLLSVCLFFCVAEVGWVFLKKKFDIDFISQMHEGIFPRILISSHAIQPHHICPISSHLISNDFHLFDLFTYHITNDYPEIKVRLPFVLPHPCFHPPKSPITNLSPEV